MMLIMMMTFRSEVNMNKMNHIKHTDLDHLRVIADWLADDHELPSTNDAACVMDAIDEIERLRKTLNARLSERQQPWP